MATITDILQSIRQAEMTPLLERIYQSPSDGPELCDVLMKYLYKGMAVSAPPPKTRQSMTPQATGGFSQIQARSAAGEGQGHAMSVLLSWHEKVSLKDRFFDGLFVCMLIWRHLVGRDCGAG